MKLKSLTDLRLVKRQIDEARMIAHAAAEQARQDVLHRAQEARWFAHAVGPVQALRGGTRRLHHPPVPPPVRPVQRQLDEAAVLRESLSDGFDVSNLLETDETLSFRRPGTGLDVLRKLRRGAWSIQAEIDLHGLRRDEARDALGGFIRAAAKSGLRCVRVVHGKGLGSPGREPVLKHKVHSWLVQKNQVLAFVQATAAEGGAGALVVLLQPRLARQARGG